MIHLIILFRQAPKPEACFESRNPNNNNKYTKIRLKPEELTRVWNLRLSQGLLEIDRSWDLCEELTPACPGSL